MEDWQRGIKEMLVEDELQPLKAAYESEKKCGDEIKIAQRKIDERKAKAEDAERKYCRSSGGLVLRSVTCSLRLGHLASILGLNITPVLGKRCLVGARAIRATGASSLQFEFAVQRRDSTSWMRIEAAVRTCNLNAQFECAVQWRDSTSWIRLEAAVQRRDLASWMRVESAVQTCSQHSKTRRLNRLQIVFQKAALGLYFPVPLISPTWSFTSFHVGQGQSQTVDAHITLIRSTVSQLDYLGILTPWCNDKCMLEGVACKPLLVVACKILAAIASAHSITTVPMNFLMTIQSFVSPMSGYFLAATVSTFIALRSISEPVSQLIWLPALVDLQITEFGFGPAPPALCHSRQNESTSHAGLLPATTFLIPPGTSSGQMKAE
ncbi:hypothetical protein F5890DRAFT_1477892 [Lentinula detonsa]|uniref:Uncharacterized protein n=1 Tax=Lentinula detonsa TaxID=2804962 RepID=A0AA38PRZ6_9AGAR|nr:hypothetical protein F5890DRAFT_1477892 [Lentinula detonsa]